MPYEYVIEDKSSRQDLRVLEDGLYDYNVEQTGRDDGRRLNIFVRDADGRVMAGLSGWTWAGWLKVNTLWVRADVRRKGHGQGLLKAAEQEAVARGCRRATLDTYSFQAPLLYQRLGYRVVAAVDDFPTGHKHYTLVKDL
ncbi:MAG TPA: GNAT family N-acetyltransferase [Methylomirabilota bacterium]|jgi:GNAT superfamily N-acetyltransferase